MFTRLHKLQENTDDTDLVYKLEGVIRQSVFDPSSNDLYLLDPEIIHGKPQVFLHPAEVDDGPVEILFLDDELPGSPVGKKGKADFPDTFFLFRDNAQAEEAVTPFGAHLHSIWELRQRPVEEPEPVEQSLTLGQHGLLFYPVSWKGHGQDVVLQQQSARIGGVELHDPSS